MPSNCYFLGQAVAVPEITTLTVGASVTTGDVYNVTVNGKTATYTAIAGDDDAAVATAIADMLSSTSVAELTLAQSYAANANVVTVTGPSDGRTMAISTSASGGSPTLTTAITTAGTGPNYWSNTANWSGGALPVDGDSVYVYGHGVSILYGIDQNAVDLALLDIDSTFTGTIGLPERNPAGAGFTEFLDTRLKLTAAVVRIGAGEGTGSQRIRLNLQSSVASAVSIYRTAQPETNEYAVSILGTNAGNTLVVSNGSVGIAEKPTDTATFTSAKIGYTSSFASDVNVFVGRGGTITTVTMNGGTLTNYGTITTLTATGGTYTHESTVTMATLTHTNTVVQWNSTATLTTHDAREGAVMDYSRVIVPRTVTNATWYKSASILDPAKTVTWTNNVQLRCRFNELGDVDFGQNAAFNRT